jgi:uncharacterized protein (TIGR02246 family)
MDILRRIEAENDIRNLQASYAQAADDADAEKFGNMFADDGELILFADVTKGRAKLGEWLMQSLSGGRLRHLNANSVVHVESENRASGALDLLLLHAREGQWAIMATARYKDVYARTSDGWKIQTREIIPMAAS